jgi:hypothetical protein
MSQWHDAPRGGDFAFPTQTAARANHSFTATALARGGHNNHFDILGGPIPSNKVRSPKAAPQYVYMDNIVWDNVVQYVQPAPMMQTIFMPYNPIERNSVAHHCLGQQKTPWQPQIEYQRKQDHYAPPVVMVQPQIRYVSQPAAVQPEIALQPVPATVYASAGSVAPVFDGYVPPMMFPVHPQGHRVDRLYNANPFASTEQANKQAPNKLAVN